MTKQYKVYSRGLVKTCLTLGRTAINLDILAFRINYYTRKFPMSSSLIIIILLLFHFQILYTLKFSNLFFSCFQKLIKNFVFIFIILKISGTKHRSLLSPHAFINISHNKCDIEVILRGEPSLIVKSGYLQGFK